MSVAVKLAHEDRVLNHASLKISGDRTRANEAITYPQPKASDRLLLLLRALTRF
ncbi:MAG TPA: hypothetical protein V6D09_23765 [Leptolyngbyaceae cyanobacterium]